MSPQLTELLVRTSAGALLACIAAVVSRKMHALSRSGAVAAVIGGTITIAAGWTWGVPLIALFVTASALSRLGERRKADLIAPIIQKYGERDASQVLANGGVYFAAALMHIVLPSPIWYAIGAGALAASAADTWATEIGTFAGRNPVSIVTGKRVLPGTSGGVTLVGSLGGAAGSIFVAAAATLPGWPIPFTAVALGGLAGALSDSLLGATLQARRWCELCGKPTERDIHDCGTPTRHSGGIEGLDNDAVNLVCSGVGALIALLLS